MAKVQQKPKTIIDLATGDSNFSTLVDAIKSADLLSTLKGKGPFTVFAPTNGCTEKRRDAGGEDRPALFRTVSPNGSCGGI